MRLYFIFSLSWFFLGVASIDLAAQSVDSLAFVEGVTILFDSAEDQLTSDHQMQIDSLIANYSIDNSLYRIEGHTDDIGSIEYNSALAERRAQSVSSYLTDIKLINSNNIFSDAYGELKPAESNLTDNSRKYNRRVDLSIYSKQAMRKIRGNVKLDSLDLITKAKILVKGKDFIDSTYTLPNGSWSMLVPDSVFVQLDISAPNYFFTSKRIKVTGALDKREIKVELPKLEVGKVYDMPDFFFKGNLPVLIKSSEPTLELLYQTMHSSTVCIHIKGHVNFPNKPPVPKSHSYYKLSEARAKMVYDFLIKKGIDSHRIEHSGYGNRYMVYPKAKNESAMKKNRRVEIEIVKCK